jgi:hypothetical protein
MGIHITGKSDFTFKNEIAGEKVDTTREAATAFLITCGLEPTPDAVGQLVEVFLPCLRIMCDRPWNPQGDTWRKSGVLGILTDVRKKFERLWYRGWEQGRRHDDSALDLINYLGFYLRSAEEGFGSWGMPKFPFENIEEDDEETDGKNF